jgi:hypothetical protein
MQSVVRGQQLLVEGNMSGAQNCGPLRVDVSLSAANAKWPIGALVSDADGKFSGSLLIPEQFTPGDYTVAVASPGNAQCSASSSE